MGRPMGDLWLTGRARPWAHGPCPAAHPHGCGSAHAQQDSPTSDSLEAGFPDARLPESQIPRKAAPGIRPGGRDSPWAPWVPMPMRGPAWKLGACCRSAGFAGNTSSEIEPGLTVSSVVDY